MKTLSLLVDAAEKLANDPQAPAALVDWACVLYDFLIDRSAWVVVKDLQLLSTLVDDYEYGKQAIAYALADESAAKFKRRIAAYTQKSDAYRKVI